MYPRFCDSHKTVVDDRPPLPSSSSDDPKSAKSGVAEIDCRGSDTCDAMPSFGLANSAAPVYCRGHVPDEMLNLRRWSAHAFFGETQGQAVWRGKVRPLPTQTTFPDGKVVARIEASGATRRHVNRPVFRVAEKERPTTVVDVGTPNTDSVGNNRSLSGKGRLERRALAGKQGKSARTIPIPKISTAGKAEVHIR